MKNYCIEWTEPCNTINCGLECSGEHICGSYAQGNNSWDAVADFYRMACFPEVNNIRNVLTEDESIKRCEEDTPPKIRTIYIPISVIVGTFGRPYIEDKSLTFEELYEANRILANKLLQEAVAKKFGPEFAFYEIKDGSYFVRKELNYETRFYPSWNEETLEYDISVFSPEEEALLKKGNMRADRKKK